MRKLTDAAIKAARCAEDKKRIELSDSACPGLILRVTRAGSKTFLLKYWSPVLSKTVGLTLGSYPALDLAAARRKVGDHRKTIAGGEDPRREQRTERKQIARQEELSFDALADRYLAEYVLGGDGGAAAVRTFNETGKWPRKVNPNKRSWKNDVSYLKRPREEWGSLTAASITDDDVAEVLDIICRERSGVGKQDAVDPAHPLQLGPPAGPEIRAIESGRWPAPARRQRDEAGPGSGRRRDPHSLVGP